MLSRGLPVHRRQRNNNWTRQKSREWAPEGVTYFYGLKKSSRHFAISCFKHAQLGTLLPEKIRTESTLAGFKRLIRTISFHST